MCLYMDRRRKQIECGGLNNNFIHDVFGSKNPWVKGIQVCSNEGPHPFPRGDN